jgi:tetratricopeptide (TPR) repeat protein
MLGSFISKKPAVAVIQCSGIDERMSFLPERSTHCFVPDADWSRRLPAVICSRAERTLTLVVKSRAVPDMVDAEKSLRHRLDDSRLLAMSCEYAAALDSIEVILGAYPENLDALRLKGNVLEQRALDENELSSRGLAISSDFLDALACYEKILRIDPKNTIGLIDLGDHYKYTDAFDQAFECYGNAIDLLEAGEARIGVESELRELLSTCADLLRYPSASERAKLLADRCERILGLRGSSDGH